MGEAEPSLSLHHPPLAKSMLESRDRFRDLQEYKNLVITLTEVLNTCEPSDSIRLR